MIISSGGELIETVDVAAEPSGDLLALSDLIDQPNPSAIVQVLVNPARNIISGNTGDGVLITGTGTNNNVVAGDFVGTDVTGTAALGNGASGVEIDLSAEQRHRDSRLRWRSTSRKAT